MNILQELSEIVNKRSSDYAYIFEGEQVTYRQLHEEIKKFALGLQHLGVQKGDHIALILDNSPEFIIGLYGAWRAGAVVIPINPSFTKEELAYILQNGDVKYLLIFQSLIPTIQKISSTIPTLEFTIICNVTNENLQIPKMKTMSEIYGNRVKEFNKVDIQNEDVAIILYTSGTTGRPKGVMLTHSNLYCNAMDVSTFLRYTEKDTIIATLPMFHVFCLTVVINATLMSGATIAILSKFSPNHVFQMVRDYGATIFAGVPTMYNYLYQYPEGKQEDFASIRLCISGGSSLPVALLEKFEEKFHVIISEGYGLSETSPVTCFNPLDRPRKAGTVGSNIVNVENKIVNEVGEEVPSGETGELIVRGPHVMKGYYKMPKETAKVLKDGWLYTGDIARRDEDGYFSIVDRKKEIIIVGGYNVYPREVEEVLHRHDSIVEAAVIGIKDEGLDEKVKAYVVVNKIIGEDELMAYCREFLVKYKVPTIIEFIDELPKNGTGKISKLKLVEKELERMNHQN